MTTTDHYEHHLGPVYLWMAGGADAAFEAARNEVRAAGLSVTPGTRVVDLGAGFGMHAIPLARDGADVVAIDASPRLLRTLDELRGAMPVRTVCDDLLAFPRHVTAAPDLILCMGDTLTHLADDAAVAALIDRAADALRPGGHFVVSLRDYTVALTGDQRFIPVRSDETRLLTCFLEYGPTTVTVHDILHERTPDGWSTRVSHYTKLRLDLDELAARMRRAGFAVRRDASVRGMARLVARRLESAHTA